ncbi:MAG: class I adenylate-forming enzyme family protein [Actinomycetota bacterium]
MRILPGVIGKLLGQVAAREPDTVAFVNGDRRLTYAEWHWLSDRAAFTLWSEGVRPGDTVALLLDASFTYPVAYLGAAKIGAITVGINTRLGQREIDHILDDSRARALVTDREGYDDPMTFSFERLNRPGGSAPNVETKPDDVVALVYTSGTTGLPKGAAFTNAALDAVREIEQQVDPVEHPKTLGGTPMAHMGFMTKIGAHIARASTTVLMRQWSARPALQAIAREKLTWLGGIPTQFALMMMDPEFADFDISSLRSCLIGGASASPDLVRKIREAFGVPITVRYSCTELAMATGTRFGDGDEVVANTVGRPLPGIDVGILDPNADGVGEIAVRSPTMMRGYWRNEEATRAAIDARGYFHTGDLGRFDADGNLHLAGRSKEMYIRGGYNVYPVEVEAVLREHPKVAQVAVIGVPDEVLGEHGRAVVVPVSDAPTLDELRAWVAARIADYKAPDELDVRDELPMTAMFKVDKQALAAETAERR